MEVCQSKENVLWYPHGRVFVHLRSAMLYKKAQGKFDSKHKYS
jgi:hypothetical protein